MEIWVDADSCPRPVREIVQRAAERTGVRALFVANRSIPGVPEGEQLVIVGSGDDAADDYIYDHSDNEDLVITRDIPLAKRLVDRGTSVINDRGDIFTRENVGERLSVRNFMYLLRNTGLLTPTERSFGAKEAQSFANAFDRELTRLVRKSY